MEKFKYLGAIISNEGSKPEILARIAQTTAALSRLKIIWRDKNISLASKVKLMQTLILSTFMLVRAGPWQQKSREGSKPLRWAVIGDFWIISYKDHVMNEEVRNKIQNATGVHDDLLTMVKERKLRWYGHISRSWGMVKTILQGTVKGARRGRQKKRFCLCWGLTSQSTIFQSCRDGATTSWIINQYFRRRDGKITSRNGWEWGLEIPSGQRKTGKGGKLLLQHHLWCPDNLRG